MNRKHVMIYSFFRPLVSLFLRIRFGYRYTIAKNLPENYIVLANHTTDYDPLFVGVSFRRQMYFVASEHIARWKHFYNLIQYGFAPITRRKGSVASTTVKEMMRHLKKGANVCLFAEGVRTWDGVTGPIHPSTAKMIKHAGCALVTYRIEGGYLTSPLWSVGKPRRGPIRGGVVNIYTKEQLASMSVEEVHTAITDDLHEDAYARQAASPAPYRGKALAEQMETLLFTCPSCLGHNTFFSEGDTVTCTACRLSFRYDEYGKLHGMFFNTVKELADWQKERVRLDVDNNQSYKASHAVLQLIVDHKEQLIDEGEVTMDNHALTCGETVFAMDSISDLAMHGQHALVFSVDKKYYELIPENTTNALKFLLYYDAYKSTDITV